MLILIVNFCLLLQIETKGIASAFSHIPVECSMPADRNETHNSQTNGNTKLKYSDDLIYSIVSICSANFEKLKIILSKI